MIGLSDSGIEASLVMNPQGTITYPTLKLANSLYKPSPIGYSLGLHLVARSKATRELYLDPS